MRTPAWGARASMALGLAVAGAATLVGCGAANPQTGSTPSPTAPAVAAAAPAAARQSTATARRVAAAAPRQSAGESPTRPQQPASTPCTTNTRSRFVFVSLRRQHVWMCATRRVAYSSAITSGMTGEDTRTPTGTFRIQGRDRNTVLTLNTGAAYHVKYWIPFDAPLFGFHDSSWQKFPYGSPMYRTAGSHGCIHLPLRTIAFLYGWAAIGTTVRIQA